MRHLKQFFLAIALLGGVATARADVVIPHVGRLIKSDASGDVPVTGPQKLKFGLYKKSVDATGENNLVWEDSYAAVQCANGLYEVDLGDTTPITQDDVAGNTSLWLQVTIFEGTADQTGTALLPRMRLEASALAHWAQDSGMLGGKTPDSYLLKADFDTFKTALTGGATGGGLTIPWASVSGVPAGFADGTDDGLTLVTTSSTLTGKGTTDDVLKVADKGIVTGLLADSAVTTAKILDANVTTAKLALGAVGSDQLSAGSVTSLQLGAKAVTTAAIADGAVTTGQIGSAAVAAGQLAANAVTTASIADSAITASKIASGAVTASVFAANTIDLTKLKDDTTNSACISGAVIKLSGTTWGCGTDVGSGGSLTFSVAAPITNTAGPTVGLADLGITTAKIAAGAWDATKIAANAVVTAGILDANVTAAKLASDANGLAKVTNGLATSTTTGIGIGTATPSTALGFGGDVARAIGLERRTSSGAGSIFAMYAGGAFAGGTDLAGGEFRTNSGVATGAGTSIQTFYTAGGGTTGTADRAAVERMRIDGNGNVGLGMTTPTSRFVARGAVVSATQTVPSSGSLAIAQSATTVTGTVAWTSGLSVGDLLTINSITRQITSISNTTSLTVDTAYSTTGSISAQSYTYQPAVARLQKSDGTDLMVASANGNIGFSGGLTLGGTTTFTGNIPVLPLGGQKYTALYARGSGNNAGAPRLVQLGGTTLVTDAVRGFNLTILNRSTLAVVSTTDYDVYGDANAANNMAAAMNALLSDKLVVVTSYDAWEGAFNEAISGALVRCGATRGLLEQARYTATSRTPYALVGICGTGGYGIDTTTNPAADAPKAVVQTLLVWDPNDSIYTPLGATQKQSVRVIETRDQRGCLPAAAADSDLITSTFTTIRQGFLDVDGRIIASVAAWKRHDVYITVDGVQWDRTLSNGNGNGAATPGSDNWEDMHVRSARPLAAGVHTVRLRGTLANTYGCGPDWGRIITTIYE